MNKLHIISYCFGMLLFIACANRNLHSINPSDFNELTQLMNTMSGEFSSQEQAEEDSLFYNINLVMHPIWESDQSAKWLYVEQAVTRLIDKPYRQRVYKLSKQADGSIASSVFELPNPSRFIHGWTQADLFKQITPDSLISRQGCAVYLRKDKNNCYSGSTKDKECLSSLRGASYATSKVDICPDQIISWDQGWNAEDQQVWGAETKGYIFKRKSYD